MSQHLPCRPGHKCPRLPAQQFRRHQQEKTWCLKEHVRGDWAWVSSAADLEAEEAVSLPEHPVLFHAAEVAPHYFLIAT